jgi:hypothetical protein
MSIEKQYLSIDFFAGDFGSPSDRTLSNVMVTASKQHKCHGNAEPCARGVLAGERYRKMVEVVDGELMDFRWCVACLGDALSEAT